MLELILRIEAAQSGSDDLDFDIAAALDRAGIKYATTFLMGPPSWTQNFDYARGLVAGFAWSVSASVPPNGMIEHSAMVARRSTIDKYNVAGIYRSEHVATPALALTAAGLKALADPLSPEQSDKERR